MREMNMYFISNIANPVPPLPKRIFLYAQFTVPTGAWGAALQIAAPRSSPKLCGGSGHAPTIDAILRKKISQENFA